MSQNQSYFSCIGISYLNRFQLAKEIQEVIDGYKFSIFCNPLVTLFGTLVFQKNRKQYSFPLFIEIPRDYPEAPTTIYTPLTIVHPTMFSADGNRTIINFSKDGLNTLAEVIRQLHEELQELQDLKSIPFTFLQGSDSPTVVLAHQMNLESKVSHPVDIDKYLDQVDVEKEVDGLRMLRDLGQITDSEFNKILEDYKTDDTLNPPPSDIVPIIESYKNGKLTRAEIKSQLPVVRTVNKAVNNMDELDVFQQVLAGMYLSGDVDEEEVKDINDQYVEYCMTRDH